MYLRFLRAPLDGVTILVPNSSARRASCTGKFARHLRTRYITKFCFIVNQSLITRLITIEEDLLFISKHPVSPESRYRSGYRTPVYSENEYKSNIHAKAVNASRSRS
ncbi:hypothetical protein B5X24_HaOG216689 [Helicoverpa armigera]|nr:hypothetical protein B5X24_HaOG216689 [Helicoverpa armigera]